MSNPLSSMGPTELDRDHAQSAREIPFEEIIAIANRLGLEYVDKRREAERLELQRTSVRAAIMNRLEEEKGSMSEARLKRLAEADPSYIQFCERLADARAETEKLRIRYESYKDLFEARRSQLSYKKAEMRGL